MGEFCYIIIIIFTYSVFQERIGVFICLTYRYAFGWVYILALSLIEQGQSYIFYQDRCIMAMHIPIYL